MTIRISGIIWLDSVIEKMSTKHHVSCEEVCQVLPGRAKFRFVEKGHCPDENVYATLGKTQTGRYLIVFFIYKSDHRILILTARDTTVAERKRYEKSNSKKTPSERDREKSVKCKSRVSRAGTYAAMADFWDEHDLSDFWDQTRPVRADVDLESEESFYAIEKGLSQTICRAAKERGVSPHTLINLWLQKRFRNSS